MWQGQFDLDNRHVVITGGASGIGFALARRLGERGCKVLLAEPDEERLANSVEALQRRGVQATYKVCDVTDPGQVEQLAEHAWEQFYRVDMLFNNAGIAIAQQSIIDPPLEQLHAVFDVNFFGVWHGCNASR